MGIINLYKTKYSDGGYELIWSETGDKGRFWLRKEVEIKSTAPFKVNIF